MKHIKAYISAVIIGIAGMSGVSAQNALRTGYFLEGYTYRHMLNPAFAPERGYFAFRPWQSQSYRNLQCGVKFFSLSYQKRRAYDFYEP